MSPAVKQNRIISVPVEVNPATATLFERVIREAVADQPELLLLDCSSLDQVISTHINLLWIANSTCLENKTELRLLNATPELRRILDLLDLTAAFKFESRDQNISPRIETGTGPASLPRSYSERIPIEINAIDRAVARFLIFLSEIGIGTAITQELRIIFYEIATNIRLHGGLTSSDQFTIDISVDKNQAILTFTDNGRPFDTTAAAASLDIDSAAKSRKRRGFGLIMIRRLANQLEYRAGKNGGNILTVYKKWGH